MLPSIRHTHTEIGRSGWGKLLLFAILPFGIFFIVGQNGQKDDQKSGCVLVDLHGVGVPWAVFGLGSKTSVLIAPMWQAVQLKISPASEQNREESDTSCVMPLMTCNYWAAQNGKSTVGS